MRHIALILTALLLASSAVADDGKPPSPGLSFFANAGAFWADKNTANFYNGRPGNANTIERVLYSEAYGREIWQTLVNDGAISPTTIGSHTQLQVVEYADMYYRLSYQIGLGMRYDYSSGFGWLLRFDLAQLTAVGAFNISSDNGAGILGNDRYVRFDIGGREERINIDFAISKTAKLNDVLDFEINLGASLINTKVKENRIGYGAASWSILDVWNGQSPYTTADSYEYINQGGIGYGVFISVLVGYNVPTVGAIKAGYTCYQAKTVLQDYTAWGWQHMLGVRIEMNNFSFIK